MSKLEHNFILKAHNPIDLVIPPIQDPFSDYEPVRSGESVLMRAIRGWESTGCWNFPCIMIYLPSKILKEVDPNQISKKFTQYLQGQYEENTEKLHLFKRNLIRVFKNAFLFLTVCMILVSIFASPSFMPNMPPVFRKVLTEGFTIIGWVVLWRPIELVINELGQLRKKNKIYQKLLSVPIQFIPNDSV